jgi:anti-sigma factor RsiW
MTHDTWTDRLSEYVDGELDPATTRALETHLAGCAECQAVASDLRQIATRARSLPDRPVRADLWNGIEARIIEGSVLPLERPARKGLFVSWPRLAAAGIALAVASGAAALALTRSRTVELPQVATGVAPVVAGTQGATVQTVGARPDSKVTQTTADAVVELQSILASRQLDSTTVKVLVQNLARIDSAIADAERALAADPSNAYVSRHLANTAKRKVELLHLVAGLTQSRS